MSKPLPFVCVLCGQHSHTQYGNNPDPMADKGKCCNLCYINRVIPARLRRNEEQPQ